MKILYVTTISNTINAFLIPHIQMLVEDGHQVDVAFKTEQEVNPQIFNLCCNVFEVCFSRSPMKKNNLRAYNILKRILEEGNYDIVHTHTPVASAITRLACKNIHKIKVIYTAHGFHFFNGAPFINWIIYYPIEKYLSKFTDVIITINREDYNRARISLKAKRVEYIPGVGINLEKFRNTYINKAQKRADIGIPENAFVLLSVGELNENKNHKNVIKAIYKVNKIDIHYIICGEGHLHGYLNNLSCKLKIDKRVHLLGFRKDIAEIGKAADVFVFPSKREGLGLAAIEAMACGLPLITSNVHGVVDYSINGVTGFAINPKDIDGIVTALEILIENKSDLRHIGENNLLLANTYAIEIVLAKMREIYRLEE